MTPQKIRGFLMQKPRPHTVRVTVDDDEQEVELGKSFARCADTIAALSPDRVACFNAAGVLLRAITSDAPDATRSDAAEIPEGLKGDSNALMVTHFANLLHRAYQFSSEIAFTKMVEVFDINSARAEAIEQRLERAEARERRLINDQIDAELDRAEEIAEGKGKEDLGEQMFGAFLSGKMSGAGAAAPTPRPPAKTNGAHKNGAGKHAPKAD
jgi:hypothetical protein